MILTREDGTILAFVTTGECVEQEPAGYPVPGAPITHYAQLEGLVSSPRDCPNRVDAYLKLADRLQELATVMANRANQELARLTAAMEAAEQDARHRPQIEDSKP